VLTVQNYYSQDVILSGGALATVSLIVSLSIALLLTDSRYWGRRVSATLEICSNPLLVVFVAIVIFKVLLII